MAGIHLLCTLRDWSFSDGKLDMWQPRHASLAAQLIAKVNWIELNSCNLPIFESLEFV